MALVDHRIITNFCRLFIRTVYTVIRGLNGQSYDFSSMERVRSLGWCELMSGLFPRVSDCSVPANVLLACHRGLSD